MVKQRKKVGISKVYPFSNMFATNISISLYIIIIYTYLSHMLHKPPSFILSVNILF